MKKETTHEFEKGKVYINPNNISMIYTTSDGSAFVILPNGQEHKYKIDTLVLMG